jgi:hypothetical protein
VRPRFGLRRHADEHAAFDVFNINRGKRTTQTFAGLASGVLGFSKLYNTHKVKLLGATSL